jgi:Photosynthetic reaction centre cytochrome C subunit
MIFRFFVRALGIVVVTASLAAGQAPAAGGQRAAGAPPAPMKNLQVLPTDTPQPQVVAMMRTFNTALGVNCDHCHVWVKPGDPTNDMASDTKSTKQVAREMMRMTTEIGAKLAASIKKPADQITRVECATCHRGAAIPVLPPPPPPVPAATPIK